ncbi:MAG: electron transfer flavoprotein subunit beta/FixA family protein [Firmicutes bacterium]|nr:electron transfer flavoprotein subunit beta/FixA family protein [Bacillota bacterium]
MNCVVLVKQVPDPNKKVGMTDQGTVDRDKSEGIMNPFDANALEMALQLKEKHGGKVTVVTMGPPKADAALREALSMGADEAFLLSDRKMAVADTLATAYTLSQAIRKIGNYDLVMSGIMAIDGDTAQVGPQIAERLGIPQVTYVEEMEIEADGKAKFKRLVEDGYEIIRTRQPLSECPVAVTVTNTANKPRYPSVMKKLKAAKAVIPTWTVADIEDSEENHSRYGMSGSPTKVKKIERPQSGKSPCKLAEGKTPDEMVECLFKQAELDKARA